MASSLRDRRALVMMTAPLVIALFVLTLLPFVATLVLSFTDLKLAAPGKWRFVELAQYQRLLFDGRWWSSLGRGLVYIAVPTALQMLLGLALALLLHSAIHAVKATRTLFILPMVLPPVVVGVLWKAFLLRDIGGLDQMLGVIGLQAPALLDSADGALWAIILVLVWEWTPFVMLLLLAALETLPMEVFEAARVDGASRWQMLRHVTLPLLVPTILVVLLFRIIESTKVFPIIFTITGGGPGQATENMDFYAYLVAFRYFDMGYASALLVAILLVFLALSAPLMPLIMHARGYDR